MYIFIMSLILSEKVKIWEDLERDLKAHNEKKFG